LKIAYLIAAHENPTHLGRLIAALSSASASFFIHIDKKSDTQAFASLKTERVHFIEDRVSVFWGDYSQVEASLGLLTAAMGDTERFDRFVLLSGVDYPLRSRAYIEQFFSNAPTAEFINLIAMPADAVGKPLSRLYTYRLRSSASPILRACRKALMMTGIAPWRRDYIPAFRRHLPYAGSSWWALSRAASEHILRFAARETTLVNFFKNTVCPDESFFQTILGNSRFMPRITRNLTYADWSRGEASPSDIAEHHLAMFQTPAWRKSDSQYGKGEILFARKFNDQSGALIDKLDRQIAANEQPHPQAAGII
jgi:hypothetical protein